MNPMVSSDHQNPSICERVWLRDLIDEDQRECEKVRENTLRIEHWCEREKVKRSFFWSVWLLVAVALPGNNEGSRLSLPSFYLTVSWNDTRVAVHRLVGAKITWYTNMGRWIYNLSLGPAPSPLHFFGLWWENCISFLNFLSYIKIAPRYFPHKLPSIYSVFWAVSCHCSSSNFN